MRAKVRVTVNSDDLEEHLSASCLLRYAVRSSQGLSLVAPKRPLYFGGTCLLNQVLQVILPLKSVFQVVKVESCREMRRNAEECRVMQSNDAPDSLSHYSKCQCSAEYLVATLCGGTTLQSHYSAENTLCGDTTLWSTHCRDTTLQSTLCIQLPLFCGNTSLWNTIISHSTPHQV